MPYPKSKVIECQTSQAAQIWFQSVRFNLVKIACDKILALRVPSLKSNVLSTGTNRTRINATHVIVEIFSGKSKFSPSGLWRFTSGLHEMHIFYN